ncbi:hypothetical protein [Pseudotenacibaculum haliotis]|uniref:Uncharacterized protein n=1 Tax=Pseudotenacibaculum haliotis TaxID=1862138 RepID=A0ABW5LNF9_9FLAO
MKYGYYARIGLTPVFVIAENIADAVDKLELKSNGKKWEFNKTASIEVIE